MKSEYLYVKNFKGRSADNRPTFFNNKTMPNDRKKQARKAARVQRSGKRLVDAAARKAKKAGKNFSASGGRKYAKGVTASQTSANYEKEGESRMSTGKKTAKKRNLKVTPRSERKSQEKYKGYGGSKKRR